MVRTRRISTSGTKEPGEKAKSASLSDYKNKSNENISITPRSKKMSASEDIPSKQNVHSPRSERKRNSSIGESGHKSNPQKSTGSPKPERRRSSSTSEVAQKSNQHHPSGTPRSERKRSSSTSEPKREVRQRSYRMHRLRFFDYEPFPINCIACDEINNKIALSRSDGSVEIWTFGSNSADLYQQLIIRNESGTSIEALLWHNKVLYRAGLDGDLVEYDMATLKPKNCVHCHAGAIWCLTLNRAKTHIAAGTEEGCVVIFEHTGEGFRYMKTLQKQEERMISIAWHEAGEVVVTGGIDNIRLWSVESGNALQRLTIARQSADKQTIVWAIAILKDMTIVSGDSSGKLIFWNGKSGTQIKMFNCHRADILSLTVNEDETQVYAAGIDPVLVQFELSPVSASHDWLVWQRSAVRAHHTHDVRAVAMINGFVITGGVDCSLVAVNLKEKLRYKTIPMPQQKLVRVARSAKLVLLQYSTSIQLWTLGVTNTQLSNRDQGTNVLPLSSGSVNLLELLSRNEENIVCSTISDEATWIAYCDRNSVRLFSLSMSRSEMLAPKISASRIRGLPASLSLLPIRCMEFHKEEKLILGYTDGSIKVVELKVTNSLPHINNVVTSTLSKDIKYGVLHQLEVSSDGSMIATSDTACNTLVYSVTNSEVKLACRLPRGDLLITSLAFSPDSNCLAYSLSSHKIMEYNLKRRCYTVPTSDLGQLSKPRRPSRVSNVVTKILNMRYSRHDSSIIFVQDALGVRGFDTKTLTLREERDLYEYRYLMHFEELDDDFALIVERSPLSLSTALPQTLSRKQFGT